MCGIGIKPLKTSQKMNIPVMIAKGTLSEARWQLELEETKTLIIVLISEETTTCWWSRKFPQLVYKLVKHEKYKELNTWSYEGIKELWDTMLQTAKAHECARIVVVFEDRDPLSMPIGRYLVKP